MIKVEAVKGRGCKRTRKEEEEGEVPGWEDKTEEVEVMAVAAAVDIIVVEAG